MFPLRTGSYRNVHFSLHVKCQDLGWRRLVGCCDVLGCLCNLRGTDCIMCADLCSCACWQEKANHLKYKLCEAPRMLSGKTVTWQAELLHTLTAAGVPNLCRAKSKQKQNQKLMVQRETCQQNVCPTICPLKCDSCIYSHCAFENVYDFKAS